MPQQEIDQAALEQMLDRLGVDGTCPRCRNFKGWEIAPRLASLLIPETPTELNLDTVQALTVIALTCNNCGFVAMHNARKLGFH